MRDWSCFLYLHHDRDDNKGSGVAKGAPPAERWRLHHPRRAFLNMDEEQTDIYRHSIEIALTQTFTQQTK